MSLVHTEILVNYPIGSAKGKMHTMLHVQGNRHNSIRVEVQLFSVTQMFITI
jgi:hypothetical protein